MKYNLKFILIYIISFFGLIVLLFSQNDTIKVGNKKFVVEAINTDNSPNSYNKNQSKKVKIVIKDFYIKTDISSLPKGKELRLKEVVEEIGGKNIFEKIADFNESLWLKDKIGLGIGLRPPHQYTAGNQSRVPKAGYNSLDDDGMVFSTLGTNGTKTSLDPGYCSIEKKVRINESLVINLYTYHYKQDINYTDYGYPQQFKEYELLDSIEIPITGPANYSITVYFDGKTWELKYQ